MATLSAEVSKKIIEQNISTVAKNAVELISTMPNGIYRDTVCSYIANTLSLHPDRIIKAVDEKKRLEEKALLQRVSTPVKPSPKSSRPPTTPQKMSM